MREVHVPKKELKRGSKIFWTSTMGSPEETEEEANAARKTYNGRRRKKKLKRLRRGFEILAATPPSKAEDQRPANPRLTRPRSRVECETTQAARACLYLTNFSQIFPHAVLFLYQDQGHAISKNQSTNLFSKS